jgi:hypothetical protein
MLLIGRIKPAFYAIALRLSDSQKKEIRTLVFEKKNAPLFGFSIDSL